MEESDEGDRNLGMEDYRRLGVEAALHAIGAVLPGRKVHSVGYCLGGTLLSIEAATMARDGDERLASITLLAAQTDFTEPGELSLFINESQVHFLEDAMRGPGFLDAKQMAGAFQMLRSNDLIWSRMIQTYFMGEREPMIDLMAWNADATRLPYRMHSEYLRRLYLNNELAAGHFKTDGKAIALTDIRAPIFAIGTVRDHVAPWRSTYKIIQQTDTDVSYLLTSGGHNAGIISQPGHLRHSYQMMTRGARAIVILIQISSKKTRRARAAPGGLSGRTGSKTIRVSRYRRLPGFPSVNLRYAPLPVPTYCRSEPHLVLRAWVSLMTQSLPLLGANTLVRRTSASTL